MWPNADGTGRRILIGIGRCTGIGHRLQSESTIDEKEIRIFIKRLFVGLGSFL